VWGGLAGAFAEEYSQGVGMFVADLPGDGFHGQVGRAQQVASAFDSQVLDEPDRGRSDGALRCPFADADGFGRVGHADGFGEMLAGPAFEGCDGGIALGQGAGDGVSGL
jgi:hypothetical protein